MESHPLLIAPPLSVSQELEIEKRYTEIGIQDEDLSKSDPALRV